MKASSTTVALFTEAGLLMKSRLRRALPMTFGQCQVLWFIEENGRPNMQDVARHFKITAPSATFVADELVRRNYAARRANAKDRRKIELVLTKKGARTCRAMARRRTQVLGEILKTLSGTERASLNHILEKIIKNA